MIHRSEHRNIHLLCNEWFIWETLLTVFILSFYGIKILWLKSNTFDYQLSMFPIIPHRSFDWGWELRNYKIALSSSLIFPFRCPYALKTITMAGGNLLNYESKKWNREDDKKYKVRFDVIQQLFSLWTVTFKIIYPLISHIW